MCSTVYKPDDLDVINERVKKMVEEDKKLDEMVATNKLQKEKIERIKAEKDRLARQVTDIMQQISNQRRGGGGFFQKIGSFLDGLFR